MAPQTPTPRIPIRPAPAERFSRADGHDRVHLVVWLLPDEFHQATGMVASQLACSVQAAADVLHEHAAASHRSVMAVADDVVGLRLQFTRDLVTGEIGPVPRTHDKATKCACPGGGESVLGRLSPVRASAITSTCLACDRPL